MENLVDKAGALNQAAPFAVNQVGGAADVLRKFDATVQENNLVMGGLKNVEQLGAGVIGVKVLAGKNVDEGMFFVRESMDRNVRLGDQDDAGNAPVLRH